MQIAYKWCLQILLTSDMHFVYGHLRGSENAIVKIKHNWWFSPELKCTYGIHGSIGLQVVRVRREIS